MTMDPCLWWSMGGELYCTLQSVAQAILRLPASSAAAERHFSASGSIIRKERARLDPERSSKLIEIYWNQKILKPRAQELCADFPIPFPPQSNAELARTTLLQIPVEMYPDTELEVEVGIEPSISGAPDGHNVGSDASDDEEFEDDEATPLTEDREFNLRFEPWRNELSLEVPEGTKVACYFEKSVRINGWYAGVVEDKVNCFAYRVRFDDGEAIQSLTARKYGSQKSWVVLSDS